jgi:hypothetical protein
VSVPRPLEITDVAGHWIVDHQRQVGHRCLQFCDCLCLDRRIHRESDVVGYIDWSGFYLGCESISLLECLGLQCIDCIEDAVELVAQLGLAPQIEIAGQHHIDGSIEVCFSRLQLARVVVSHSALVRRFDRVDQGLYLGSGSRCWRWVGRRRGWLGRLRGLERWGRRLRRLRWPRGHRVFRHTPRNQHRGRG